jgi:PPOX class probable F420-dependent enzyme
MTERRDGQLDSDVRRFVEAQRIARLTTVDGRGRPHVVPVCFALDDDTVYSAIDEKPKRGGELRRLANIRANPHVQLLVDVYDDVDWSRLRYVQLRGRARIIEGGEDHARAIALLRARYAQYQEMALESRPVIAIDIDRVVEWRADGMRSKE